MWVRILTFLYCILLLFDKFCLINGHLPGYVSTPASKVEQYCLLSESCTHDTVAICGIMGEKKRTFLDLCDLLEFACDTNQLYSHIDDEEGCPVEKKPHMK